MMNKFKFEMGLIALAVIVLLPTNVSGTIIADNYFTYTPLSGPGTVTVHSWVEDFPAVPVYRYNYQILDPSINIQWFSVELLVGVTINGSGYSGAGNAPALWAENGLSTSFDATFINPILPPSGSSVVLWFESPQAPTTEDGMAAGITGGQYNAFYGALYTPVPEPMTIGLLALGAGYIVRRKGKKI